MKPVLPHDVIDVQALRVGMFVHLEGGWMSHPFPLSSFRIVSAEQLATIRSLGVPRVRWSPTQSDSADALDDASERASAAARSTTEAANDPAASAPAEVEREGPDTIPDLPAEGPAADVCHDPAERRGRAAEAERLARQRAAQQLCERQYGEAARDCRKAFDAVIFRPQEARQQAEKLSNAIVAKMIGAHDVCVRMLGETVGDKASMHAMNVAVISLLMGRCFGFSPEEMQELGMGAMLHDIGKIEMPARLRHREDNFSPSELRAYQEHVELGVVQAGRMGLSAGAASVVAQHHEHADGSGFPAALNSDRMTMAARIVALVDRYDNLCNPHLPARALTPHESISLLFAQGRSKYDTSILGAFIKMMGVYPPGSTVQLTDDRYAMVVAINSSRPIKPSVLVYDADVPREQTLVLDLERSPALGIRRSIRPAHLPPAALDYLAPAPRVAYFFEIARVEEAMEAA